VKTLPHRQPVHLDPDEFLEHAAPVAKYWQILNEQRIEPRGHAKKGIDALIIPDSLGCRAFG
jgi:hypothetical protein